MTHACPRRLALMAPFALALGCGGAAKTPALKTAFDPSGNPTGPAPVDVTRSEAVEQPVPALDGGDASGRWVGVSILHGAVRFRRPATWTVRDASNEEGREFVRYVSPNAYSFAFYERADGSGDSWRHIVEHYEADVTANGAHALGFAIPVVVGANQGRAYTIDRKIDAKPPVLSRSREILLRGAHDVVLLQVVTTEQSLARIAAELLEIYRHVEVD